MKFNGSQAAARHQQKRLAILRWTYRFAYTDTVVVGLLLGLKKSAAANTLAALVRDGLMARIQGHGVVTWMFRLTPDGARYIVDYLTEFDAGMPPQTNPSDIGTHLARHNLVAQRLAADLLAKRKHGAEVLAPRQILSCGYAIGHRDESRGAWKIPDALVLDSIPEDEQEAHGRTHLATAIEVQQSPEAHASRAHKLWQYWTALCNGQITGFIYASTDPTILAAYASQWRHDLVERIYIPSSHKWIKPECARRVESDNELLDDGECRLLAHEPFGVGLYPRFDASPGAASQRESDDADDDGDVEATNIEPDSEEADELEAGR